MEYLVEFIPEEHIYLINGVIVPCVSELLAFKFPNKYKGIDKQILKNKADFGTRVHKGVESIGKQQMPIDEALGFIESFCFYEKLCLREYLKLKQRYDIVEDNQEIIVNYEDIYAGTLDMEGTVALEEALLDIKTTAELDKIYLAWQLSLYEMARGKTYKKFYCIWLPKKDIGRLVPIERIPKEELLSLIVEYKKSKGEI